MKFFRLALILLFVSTAIAYDYPVGARPGGMGDAYIAACDNALGLYHNPGALLSLRSISLNLSFGWEGFPLMRNWGFFYAKPVIQGKQVGLGMLRMKHSIGGADYTSYQVIMPLTYALSKRIGSGIAVKYAAQKRESDNFNAKLALDFGVQAELGALNLAFVARNFTNPDMSAYPRLFEAGAALIFPIMKLETDAVVDNWEDFKDKAPRLRIGAEITPKPSLSLRAGWTEAWDQDLLSLGFGFHDPWRNLALDYCYRARLDKFEAGTHWFSYTFLSTSF